MALVATPRGSCGRPSGSALPESAAPAIPARPVGIVDIERDDDASGLAKNYVARSEAPGPRIDAVIAGVAHDEILPMRDGDGNEVAGGFAETGESHDGVSVARKFLCGKDGVRAIELGHGRSQFSHGGRVGDGVAVEAEAILVESNLIARNADYAFDEMSAVPGGEEHDNIAALGVRSSARDAAG